MKCKEVENINDAVYQSITKQNPKYVHLLKCNHDELTKLLLATHERKKELEKKYPKLTSEYSRLDNEFTNKNKIEDDSPETKEYDESTNLCGVIEKLLYIERISRQR
jgi:preprotein translocase subunit Sec63